MIFYGFDPTLSSLCLQEVNDPVFVLEVSVNEFLDVREQIPTLQFFSYFAHIHVSSTTSGLRRKKGPNHEPQYQKLRPSSRTSSNFEIDREGSRRPNREISKLRTKLLGRKQLRRKKRKHLNKQRKYLYNQVSTSTPLHFSVD